MPAAVNKVIVTNLSVLKSKYTTGFAAVDKAIKRLIVADAARGLKTVVVDVSDATQMKSLGGKAVTSVKNARQHKEAVDAIFRKLVPEYLVLLGSPDVIPHQRVKNLSGDDDGTTIPSDLPYACDAPYSQDPRKFRGPTRVVGRLPDLQGGKDPSALVTVLDFAANHQSRPASDFQTYFGLSAEVWKGSTQQSLKNIFGSQQLAISPPSGPPWSVSELKPRMHFINCHGAPADFHFYGQRGQSFPVSHETPDLAGKIVEGTVATAECCFGAELYNSFQPAQDMGICNRYLLDGAAGFFGSTTTAYGPATGNGQADIITQDFLKHVLSGASLGRAALQARQDYVLKNAVLDPIDLKTLSQFYLLGDPSLHPITAAAPAAPHAKGLRGILADAGAAARVIRRNALAKNGLSLMVAANFVQTLEQSVAKATTAVQNALEQALGTVDSVVFQKFSVGEVAASKLAKLSAKGMRMSVREAPSVLHFALGKRSVTIGGKARTVFVAARAREVAGRLADVRTSFSH